MKITIYLFLAFSLFLLVWSFLPNLDTLDINFHDTYYIFDHAWLLRWASCLFLLVTAILFAVHKLNQKGLNK